MATEHQPLWMIRRQTAMDLLTERLAGHVDDANLGADAAAGALHPLSCELDPRAGLPGALRVLFSALEQGDCTESVIVDFARAAATALP